MIQNQSIYFDTLFILRFDLALFQRNNYFNYDLQCIHNRLLLAVFIQIILNRRKLENLNASYLRYYQFLIGHNSIRWRHGRILYIYDVLQVLPVFECACVSPPSSRVLPHKHEYMGMRCSEHLYDCARFFCAAAPYKMSVTDATVAVKHNLS